MKKIVILTMVLLALSSCSVLHVHKMDVEQGNVVTEDMIKKLHPGMTEAEVRNIMGTPILLNTFNDHRADYIYTFKPGYGNVTEKSYTLIFHKGILKEIKGNMYSQFLK